eukprot:TRINITY_DN464_c0_g1_i1.p1 TRINITY_DN464_c0_g1~~TRINITY_DN464_c0_g1_i1.p1  ORF type:complete len:175 (+),score=20.69 TRINITY_DN464_c0_g1_i1:144-668(+)
MIRRPPRSTQSRSSAASDVYKRQPCAPLPVRLPKAGRQSCSNSQLRLEAPRSNKEHTAHGAQLFQPRWFGRVLCSLAVLETCPPQAEDSRPPEFALWAVESRQGEQAIPRSLFRSFPIRESLSLKTTPRRRSQPASFHPKLERFGSVQGFVSDSVLSWASSFKERGRRSGGAPE